MNVVFKHRRPSQRLASLGSILFPGMLALGAVPTAEATSEYERVRSHNGATGPDDGCTLGYRFVSGTVFEATQTGTRPAAGTYVDYEPPGSLSFGEPLWAAETFSDAEGHYLLCGLPDAETVLITAGRASVSVPPGVSTGVDLVIR